MRDWIWRIALVVSVFGISLAGQDQPPIARPQNDVQVGVPDGAPARQGGARGGRGRQGGPAGPAPRNAEGRVVLGGGLWLPGPVVPNQLGPVDAVPFQPWARALVQDRLAHRLEPHARCKASGVARPFLTPYGVEIVELPDTQRIFIFDVGGPHTWRTVYMDGRTHPGNPSPSYYGHSIGWWEGDTLVIDSRGFNESFWLDRDGLPHSEKLRTVERLTRTDANTISYELMVDDPEVYTSAWKGQMNLRFDRGTELFEYVCQEQNYAHDLMLGSYKSVDRTTPIVP